MASIHIPSNAELFAAAETARAAGMSLYIDGERAVIAPHRPTLGRWVKVGVKVINRHNARAEVLPCPA